MAISLATKVYVHSQMSYMGGPNQGAFLGVNNKATILQDIAVCAVAEDRTLIKNVIQEVVQVNLL